VRRKDVTEEREKKCEGGVCSDVKRTSGANDGDVRVLAV